MANSLAPITIEYDLPAFFKAIADLSHADAARVLHSFRAGLDTLALEYQRQWRAYASGAPIPGTTRRIHSKGPYVNSIQVDLSADLEKKVYTNYKYAGVIESGHGEIDLKANKGPHGGLLHGPKARLSKGRATLGRIHGLPHAYNIVSFRHGTPRTSQNAMPKDIYAQIRRMFSQARQANMQTVSRVISKTGGKVVEHPDTGEKRELPIYSWGVRTGELGERKRKKNGYQWKTGKQSGLVRMQGNTYRTFRTVSKNSDPKSWVVPALAALPIRQIVVDHFRRNRRGEKILYDAILRDLTMGGAQGHYK